MRTTLHLDDDAYQIVVRYAKARGIGLGKAASELLRRGAQVKVRTRRVNGLVVFDPPLEAPEVTPAQVRQLLAEEE